MKLSAKKITPLIQNEQLKMKKVILFLSLLSVACGKDSITEPMSNLACTRSYVDADAYISVCYLICPKDMEDYARVTNQKFTRVATCTLP